jgi:ribosomal protein L11 methyltransferase
LEPEAFKEIRVDLSQADGQRLTRIVDESGIPGLEGYFETLYEENKRSDTTALFFYFAPEDEHASIKIELLLSATATGGYATTERTVARTEYLESYKKHYQPFTIGRTLAVVPSWKKGTDEERSLEDRTILYLDPGLAFGTGLHATTRLCLSWMEDNRETLEGKKLIDAGCGSGVLGLFALLLGVTEVLAFDVESNAIRATRQNLSLNPGIAPHRMILRQSGFEFPELKLYAAEIFVGNLTSAIIIGARDSILSANHHRMVLTGILSEQKEKIISVFPGWSLRGFHDEDGWCLVDFAREYGSV